jgi:phage tail sheath protein FI
MPEYLSPGVYVEEVTGPQPIVGVSTSTTGMVGVTLKGPTSGKPVLVTSFAEFRATFGDFYGDPVETERNEWALDDDEGGQWWLFPMAAKGFFDNGGQRLYVKRVFSSTATPATAAVDAMQLAANETDPRDPAALQPTNPPSTALTVSAKALGSWANGMTVVVRPAVAQRFRLLPATGGRPTTGVLAKKGTARDTSLVLRQVLPAPSAPFQIELAGDRVSVQSAQERQLTTSEPLARDYATGSTLKVLRTATPAAPETGLRIATGPAARIGVGQLALVSAGSTRTPATVQAVVTQEDVQAVTLVPVAGNLPATLVEGDVVEFLGLTLEVLTVGDVVESFGPLLIGELADTVTRESLLVDVDLEPGFTLSWTAIPATSTEGLRLDGGGDGLDDLSSADFVGTDAGSGRRTGIRALEDIEDISLCAVPGVWSRTVQSALISHCEALKNRFAVIDPPLNLSVQQVQAYREPFDTKYAALYHPWLELRDPRSLVENRALAVPPSGHMLGIYARTDIERGVHKAPANVVVQEITRFTDDINKGEQDVLNPLGINALRYFPGRGLRVWGARTLSSLTLERYVNVRRLLIFIEESIRRGTQWVVFEPNDPRLWSQVRQVVTSFLVTVWRSGALFGTTAEEAFFVRCDRSTMTPQDVIEGRLICEIGVAPVRPAEFVIFRIQQITGLEPAA